MKYGHKIVKLANKAEDIMKSRIYTVATVGYSNVPEQPAEVIDLVQEFRRPATEKEALQKAKEVWKDTARTGSDAVVTLYSSGNDVILVEVPSLRKVMKYDDIKSFLEDVPVFYEDVPEVQKAVIKHVESNDIKKLIDFINTLEVDYDVKVNLYGLLKEEKRVNL